MPSAFLLEIRWACNRPAYIWSLKKKKSHTSDRVEIEESTSVSPEVFPESVAFIPRIHLTRNLLKAEVQLGRWWETFCRSDQRDLIQLARAPAPKASSLWEEPHELPAAAPWQVALRRSVPLKPCQSQFGVKWEHVVHQRRHSAPFIVVLLMWKCHPLAIKSAPTCWSCYQQPLFVGFSWWLLVSTSSSVFFFFFKFQVGTTSSRSYTA